MTQDSPIACLLVIGNEVLSGRTRDANVQFLATRLGEIGVPLREVRVIPDVRATIVGTLNEVRPRFDHVFTTGGIGPTHDDITADCVAKAFGLPIDVDPRAVAMMRERFKPEELNEARLRMARMPEGADLVQNSYNKVPGFRIGNVIVMAGVPVIMQAMLDAVAPTLQTGVKLLSESVRADMREGDIGEPLRAVAKAHPATMIGSYPFWDEAGQPNTNLIVRSREPAALAAAMADVKAMLAALARA
jgi:molybdenum cofactor synthesis domain-containing protein